MESFYELIKDEKKKKKKIVLYLNTVVLLTQRKGEQSRILVENLLSEQLASNNKHIA
jgi:hypothetical protein